MTVVLPRCAICRLPFRFLHFSGNCVECEKLPPPIDPQQDCLVCADPWKTPCQPGHCAEKERKQTT